MHVYLLSIFAFFSKYRFCFMASGSLNGDEKDEHHITVKLQRPDENAIFLQLHLTLKDQCRRLI